MTVFFLGFSALAVACFLGLFYYYTISRKGTSAKFFDFFLFNIAFTLLMSFYFLFSVYFIDESFLAFVALIVFGIIAVDLSFSFGLFISGFGDGLARLMNITTTGDRKGTRQSARSMRLFEAIEFHIVSRYFPNFYPLLITPEQFLGVVQKLFSSGYLVALFEVLLSILKFLYHALTVRLINALVPKKTPYRAKYPFVAVVVSIFVRSAQLVFVFAVIDLAVPAKPLLNATIIENYYGASRHDNVKVSTFCIKKGLRRETSKPRRVDGPFDRDARLAMWRFQKRWGIRRTNYPNIETAALLGCIKL